MKNATLFVLIIVILAVLGVFVFNSMKLKVDGNVTSIDNISSGDIQKIVLSMKNYNYYPTTIRVRVGQPLSISLDNSVGGCYRTLVISALGLRKTFRSSSDTLDFTPTEKGTYEFACSMRMGRGTLIVE